MRLATRLAWVIFLGLILVSAARSALAHDWLNVAINLVAASLAGVVLYRLPT